MKKEFKVGDVVTLKSGGPQMTVAEVFSGRDLVEVVYTTGFDKGLQSARVPMGVLKALELKKVTRTYQEREFVTKDK